MTRKETEHILSELGIRVSHENGDWLIASCPFAKWTHKGGVDRNPSFGVRMSLDGKSGYNCFACGKMGTMSGLVRSLGVLRGENYVSLSLAVVEAENKILTDFEKIHAKKPKEYRQQIDERFTEGIFEKIEDHPIACKYMAHRGISLETVERLGLLFDVERERIIFPVRGERGELYGYTGRLAHVDEKMKLVANAPPKVRDYYGLQKKLNLLGSERLIGAEAIVLVEGLFAYAHFSQLLHNQFGYENFAVVASMGARLSDEQAQILIRAGKPVYAFYDGDEAGDLGIYGEEDEYGNVTRKGVIHLLSDTLPTMIPKYPSGKDDPDDLTFEELDWALRNSSIV